MLIGFGIFILVIIVFLVVFWERLPFRLIIPYIKKESIVNKGRVEKVQIDGKEGGAQTFFVYLPEDYDSSDKRYKVLYHLHGAFMRESWAAYEANYLGSKVEQAAQAGIIEPMIVVTLYDSVGGSMWSDSYDGQYAVSTGFLEDIIPHIDANYRTLAERNSRALQGFSMGGFGAVVNGFRAPDLFNAIIIWDGALHSWETISTKRKGIANKMFASEDYFKQWSPWEIMENSQDVDMDIFMVVGEMNETRSFGYPFRKVLEKLDRKFTYHDVACPHSIFCIMDTLGEEGFKFLASSFAGRQD